MTAMSICYITLWLYASRSQRLLRDNANPRVVSGITRSYVPGSFIYFGATLLAFISPIAAVVAFGAIAVFYVVESSVFGRAEPA
jgi:hypothetical protein